MLREGQVIAIPVLTRHIETSSGKCSKDNLSYNSNCIMADALRDRFPGAKQVSVGTSGSKFNFEGQTVYLSHHSDMENGIRAFDSVIDDVRTGEVTFEDAQKEIRQRIPRVAHATVTEVYQF